MKDILYEARKDRSSEIFAEIQHEYNGRMHFHRAFELGYIIEGSAKYTVEDECFTVQQDQIVFSHCYYRHTSTTELKHKKYIIAVPEKLSRDIVTLFSETTLPALLEDKEFNKTLRPFFEKLAYECATMPKILAKGYANVIFGSLSQHYNSIAVKPKNKNVLIIADILEYIDNHYMDKITLESLSSTFGYNKTYFSRLFNQHIGMSVNNYINMVRLDYFEKLYDDSKCDNITELVFDCGFSSLATFYRVREFRRKSKNINLNIIKTDY